jgi:hypothetical protein
VEAWTYGQALSRNSKRKENIDDGKKKMSGRCRRERHIGVRVDRARTKKSTIVGKQDILEEEEI